MKVFLRETSRCVYDPIIEYSITINTTIYWFLLIQIKWLHDSTKIWSFDSGCARSKSTIRRKNLDIIRSDIFIHRYKHNNSKLRHRRYIRIPTKINNIINITTKILLYNTRITKCIRVSSHAAYTKQKLSERGKSKHAKFFRKRII